MIPYPCKQSSSMRIDRNKNISLLIAVWDMVTRLNTPAPSTTRRMIRTIMISNDIVMTILFGEYAM
jgi:hypothetical protein